MTALDEEVRPAQMTSDPSYQAGGQSQPVQQELAIIVGFAFAAGFFAGVWVRR
jgi:hypothetical protein